MYAFGSVHFDVENIHSVRGLSFSVRGFELYGVPRAQQNCVYGFHGVGAYFVAQHVNSHDGQYVRARNRTERKGMDETGDATLLSGYRILY